MSFDPEKVQRKLTLFGHACVLSEDYDRLLAMYKALQAENAELKASREKSVDLLASYFQDVKSSRWLAEDDRINALRQMADDVYEKHRARDFTKARIEAFKAVIGTALKDPELKEEIQRLKGEGQ